MIAHIDSDMCLVVLDTRNAHAPTPAHSLLILRHELYAIFITLYHSPQTRKSLIHGASENP